MDWHKDVRLYYQENIVDQEVHKDIEMKIQLSHEFQVFGKDSHTYFIMNLDSSDCCWCYANKSLELREIVHGQLLTTTNAHDLPTLIIHDEQLSQETAI